MIKITIGVEGMQCPKCEKRVNDIILQEFKVEEVISSHEENQTVIITGEDIAEADIQEIIAIAGYGVTSIKKEPYKKRFLGLF